MVCSPGNKILFIKSLNQCFGLPKNALNLIMVEILQRYNNEMFYSIRYKSESPMQKAFACTCNIVCIFSRQYLFTTIAGCPP